MRRDMGSENMGVSRPTREQIMGLLTEVTSYNPGDSPHTCNTFLYVLIDLGTQLVSVGIGDVMCISIEKLDGFSWSTAHCHEATCELARTWTW